VNQAHKGVTVTPHPAIGGPEVSWQLCPLAQSSGPERTELRKHLLTLKDPKATAWSLVPQNLAGHHHPSGIWRTFYSEPSQCWHQAAPSGDEEGVWRPQALNEVPEGDASHNVFEASNLTWCSRLTAAVPAKPWEPSHLISSSLLSDSGDPGNPSTLSVASRVMAKLEGALEEVFLALEPSCRAGSCSWKKLSVLGFLVAVTNSWEKQPREGRIYFAHAFSGSWPLWQIRKQRRENTSTSQLPSSPPLVPLGPRSVGWCHPHSGQVICP
jgi:hypothetical protein